MENLALIRKLAWSFHTSTGIDIDDLIQEASIAYLEALKSYDNTKGKLSVHVWCCMRNHLKNYVNEEMKFITPKEDIVMAINKPVKENPFFEFVSKEASMVASWIVKHPRKFDLMNPAEAKAEVVKDLLNQGIEWKDISVGMKDLSVSFSH